MKNKFSFDNPATAISLLAFLAANLTLNIDVAHARFGGGGFGGGGFGGGGFGGFHGGGFGGFNQGGFGGDFRGGSIFHSDSDFNRPTFDQTTGQNAVDDRSWGNLQQNNANFGQTFDENRTNFQQNRQNEINSIQQNRTNDLNSIEQNRTDLQQNQINAIDNLQQNRINTVNNLQQNRINTVDNLQKNQQNYWNSRDWNNGYYYPGWGCCDDNGWGWGAAGLATGLTIGSLLNSLPSGYTTVPVGSNNYYYYNGSYYLPSGSGYQVVTPPVNAVVSSLPFGYTQVYAYGSSEPYYYYNGAFYNSSNGGYMIIQPPTGVMVPYLPTGYTTKVINGTTYYQYGSVTYRPYYSGGQVIYIVANP